MAMLRASTLLLSAAFATSLGCAPGSFISGTGDDDLGDDDVSSGSDAAAPGTPDAGPPADFALTLDSMAGELVLGESKSYLVTVTGENGFTGPVALAATGQLATWQASFDTDTVTVPAGGSITATLTVAIPTDAEPGTAVLGVSGTGAPGERLAPTLDLTVKPELVIRIPTGSVDNPENSFGPGGVLNVRFLNPGTKITWVNDDNVNHRIHADNVSGFDHQDNEMGKGQSYTITVNAPGVYDYNCHIHGQMTGRLIVQ